MAASDRTATNGGGTRRVVVLVVFFAVTFAAAGIGSRFLPGAWYAGLVKPSWNPPNWIFAPVWSVLYVMIAIAGALAFSAAGMQAAIIVGPAVGGFIYVAGAAAVYAVSAGLFLLACALLIAMRHRQAPRIREPVTLATLFAGVAYIRQREVILGAISLDLFAVLLGGATALLPIFAKDVLHVGPSGLGLLRSAPAGGALAISLALTRWPLARGVGRLLFVSVAVYGLATLVFALSSVFLLSLVALLVSGAADMVSVVIRQSLVQLETPDAMRGRVSAVNSIFIGASNQLGEFESGAVAAWIGPIGSVVVGGIGTLLVAGAWIGLFPALYRRDHLSSSVESRQ